MTNTLPYSKSDTNKYLVLGLNVTLLQINIVYHIIMYSCNIGSHFEFQDGQQVLNNTRLDRIYHNECLKPMSNYLLILKSKYDRKCDFRFFSMTAFWNSKLTKSHTDFSLSLLGSLSSKIWLLTPIYHLYLS
jgi:hypothetical protein